MILCWVKYIYNWVAEDTMLWEIYLIIESLMILCYEKYIYNWVADNTMLCEIYL